MSDSAKPKCTVLQYDAAAMAVFQSAIAGAASCARAPIVPSLVPRCVRISQQCAIMEFTSPAALDAKRDSLTAAKNLLILSAKKCF